MRGLRIPDFTDLESIETKVPMENLTPIGMDFLKVTLFRFTNLCRGLENLDLDSRNALRRIQNHGLRVKVC